MPESIATTPYGRNAIFDENGPFQPSFVDEAVRTMMRTLPLETPEPPNWVARRMLSALNALGALHPRDEIEIMLGVQAMSAYHAASACWRIGMNLRQPNGESTRHITAAATAARTFDTMLRAIERRQAKPLSVPIGRPEPREWKHPNDRGILERFEKRCRGGETEPLPAVTWDPDEIAKAHDFITQIEKERENEGLDIANTEGILPGGGMVMPEDPTPQQQIYIGRRLLLELRRKYAENKRNGSNERPKIKPIRPGDLIP